MQQAFPPHIQVRACCTTIAAKTLTRCGFSLSERLLSELDAYMGTFIPRLRAVCYKYSLTVIIIIVSRPLGYTATSDDLELLSDVTAHRVCTFRRRTNPIITAVMQYYIIIIYYILYVFFFLLFRFHAQVVVSCTRAVQDVYWRGRGQICYNNIYLSTL